MSEFIIGKLEQVELRQLWAKEHLDFTPWLAENLHFLGEAIGSDLELESQEMSVGSFRADILAKDTKTNTWVLIENQLERTDHSHLGQLVTYAAGLKATTIVWIAYQFADEHIAALDWLNSITDDSVQFFGIQIELWRINDGVAPKFNIVSRPNSWVRKSKKYKEVARSANKVIAEQIRALLDADPGLSGREIAKRLECSPTTANKWKNHFETGGSLPLSGTDN